MLLRRRLMVSVGGGDDFVDLGLPSGTLWAKGNLCKDSQGKYFIGEETDYGTYVSWGNIDGHNEGEGYNFNSTNYNNSPGKQLTSDIPVGDTYDIARARLSSPWRIPTRDDFQELYDNTDSEWVANYNNTGVVGRKYMKKSDHSVYIFLPASGDCNGTSQNNRNTNGYYRSSSYYNANYAYYVYFNKNNVMAINRNLYRYYGMSLRAVCKLYFNITITLTGDSVSGITIIVTDSDGIAHSGTTDSNGVVQIGGVASGSAKVSASGYYLTNSSIFVNASSRSFTCRLVAPLGIWAYYADGSLKSEAEADSNAIGVAVLTENCGFVIDKTVTDSGNRPAFGGMYKDLSGIGVVVTSSESDAKLDFDGKGNTPKIIAACAGYTAEGVTGAPAAEACRAAFNGEGYLGSLGEWTAARANKAAVDSMMSKIGGTVLPSSEQYIVWSSTLRDATTFAWHLEWSDIGGTYWYSNRSGTEYVRAFKAL